MTAPPPDPAPSMADSFVLSCIDPRIVDDTTFYLAALGKTDRYSEMRIAGAGMALADPARAAWGQSVQDNLAASIQLHGIRRVVIVNHRDCGAMNLFAGRTLTADPADEALVHAEVMNRAAAAIRARHPDLLIELRLMSLDGGVQYVPCEVCSPARGLRAEALAPGTSQGAEPARLPAERFADVARLRLGGGALGDRAAVTALLAEGVTTYGLSAQAARELVERAREEAGSPGGERAERDVTAFLRSRADGAGRIAKSEVEQAASLYRALAGPTATRAGARARAASLALEHGLRARPAGWWPFRSTAWLDRMAAPA